MLEKLTKMVLLEILLILYKIEENSGKLRKFYKLVKILSLLYYKQVNLVGNSRKSQKLVKIVEKQQKILEIGNQVFKRFRGTFYTIGGHIVRIRLLIVSMNIVNFMSLNLDSYCMSCFICVDLCGIVENYKKLEYFVRNTINCLILV